MSGQHRADSFGSMSLEDEQQLRRGDPPRPLRPFPDETPGPGALLPSLPAAPGPVPALELAHDERGQAEQLEQLEQLEQVWPADPLDRWEADQLEQIRAEFLLLRRMNDL